MRTWRGRFYIGCWVLLLGAWASQCGGSTGRAKPLDDLVESPVVWRAFRPLVIAMGEGDPQRAVRYLREGNRILRNADVNLELDEPTETFRERAHASMQKFDLKSFLALLPERDGDYRYFGFAGEDAGSVYRVRAARGGDFEVHATSKRRRFGDASGVIRMRKRDQEDTGRYIVHWRTGAGFGELSWPSILDGLKDALRMFDERLDPKDTPLVLRAADSFLQKTEPSLDGDDRRILAQAWASFPEVAKLLISVGTTEDVIAGYDAQTGVTHVRLVSRWSIERLGRNYPKLAGYFRDLGKLAKAKILLLDGNGYALGELHLDTEHMRSRLEFFARNGEIVPSKQGKPQPDRKPRFDTMRSYANLHFQAYRVHFYVQNLVTEIRYREKATGAELSAHIRDEPKFTVKGAAFGIFPTGMLDLFIPGDMEGLGRRFFEAAVHGNEGRGIEARYRFERPQGGLATLDGQLGIEVLDSALIRFAMAIAAKRVVPDEKQLDDMRRLAGDYRSAFDADVVRFGKFGRVAAPPSEATSSPPSPVEPVEVQAAP